MAEIKLYEQSFDEALKNRLLDEAFDSNSNLVRTLRTSGITLLGLVYGEGTDIATSAHSICVELAIDHLRRNAKKIQATHVFQVSFDAHSNRNREYVIASGDAYIITPRK